MLALAVPAAGQSTLQVSIREALLSPDGNTRLVVAATGSAVGGTLDKSNFAVSEAGEAVSPFTVEPLNKSAKQPGVSVALVMDVSGSMIGQPLVDAKAAARQFVASLPPSVRIALIAFGPTAGIRVGFTTDKTRLFTAINALQAGGGTALYDAVVLAASVLGPITGTQHNVILFSDGGDSGSRHSLGQAINAAAATHSSVTSVGLVTQTFDQNALNQLAAAVPGGRSLPVSKSAELAAAFKEVAQEIASQYVITYVSTRREPSDLDIVVRVAVGGVQSQDTSTVINPRTEQSAGQTPGTTAPRSAPSHVLVPLFANKTGYYVGVGSVFLAVLLLLGMLLYAPSQGPAALVLQRGLRLYQRGERTKEKRQEGLLSGSAAGRRAMELIDRLPRSEAFEERLQLLLDRAAWPLRSTEFLFLQILGGIVGGLLGFGLLGRWWLGIVFVIAGMMVPRLVLAQRVGRRESQFLSQLPDTLQLLAGSLQAGYGFMQAIDTVAKEAQPPASTEFSRVLAESRLGMPVDEALNSMADRVGSEDFRWVVLAINIQRQVGGNLAALLTTVANTLREREQLRRQINVLSAEGRLSAIILVALPFGLVGYISVVNPGYLQQLTSATIGKIMIGVGLLLIGVGIVWMRKIIKIDV
jgi:tight adherence protein B